MDCEYVLFVGPVNSEKEIVRFHGSTPDVAVIQAEGIVKEKQKEQVVEFPFAPPIVTGVLYRGFREINGGQFIKKA